MSSDLIGELAAFDVAAGRACFNLCDSSVGVTAAGTIWGSGNSVPAFFHFPSAHLKYMGTVHDNFVIANSSGSDFKFSNGRTSVRAFDDSVGAFTAPRLMTFANLAASVATGGFGGNVFDPVTGSGIFLIV